MLQAAVQHPDLSTSYPAITTGNFIVFAAYGQYCPLLPAPSQQVGPALLSNDMISACSQACHYCCSSSASLRHTCLSGIPGRTIRCAAWGQHHVPLEIFLRNLSTHFCAIFFCIIFLFDSMGIVIFYF